MYFNLRLESKKKIGGEKIRMLYSMKPTSNLPAEKIKTHRNGERPDSMLCVTQFLKNN